METRLALLAPLCLLVACSSPSDPSEEGVHAGSVQVALTNVPTGVSCIRLTLVGSGATVQRSFDVAPRVSSILAVDNLPVGSMTFSADAFGTACASVGATAVGAWVSDKQTVNLVAGVPSFLTLTMTRNGKACVSVDFPSDGFSGDAGTTDAGVGPTATIASGPTGATNATSATFSITASTTDAVLQCSLDTAAFAVCTSPVAYTGLANGAHTFRVRAVSPTCVFGPIATRTWTVDTVAPAVTITSGPTGTIASPSAGFAFTSSEPGSLACWLDGAAPAPCTSPFSVSGLANGAHTFQVRATDAAGNTATTSRAFTVDTIAPDTTITSGPTGTVATTSAAFTFTASEATAAFQCSLDAGSYVACTSPITYSALTAGTHTFRVRAADAFGNADATPATVTWTIAL